MVDMTLKKLNEKARNGFNYVAWARRQDDTDKHIFCRVLMCSWSVRIISNVCPIDMPPKSFLGIQIPTPMFW